MEKDTTLIKLNVFIPAGNEMLLKGFEQRRDTYYLRFYVTLLSLILICPTFYSIFLLGCVTDR